MLVVNVRRHFSFIYQTEDEIVRVLAEGIRRAVAGWSPGRRAVVHGAIGYLLFRTGFRSFDLLCSLASNPSVWPRIGYSVSLLYAFLYNLTLS